MKPLYPIPLCCADMPNKYAFCKHRSALCAMLAALSKHVFATNTAMLFPERQSVQSHLWNPRPRLRGKGQGEGLLHRSSTVTNASAGAPIVCSLARDEEHVAMNQLVNAPPNTSRLAPIPTFSRQNGRSSKNPRPLELTTAFQG
ncbi:hypothetical protein Plim_2880 [Planctopirus limnophila DSM 3776]|uniref:Uncharacterized protein n=1 Tax=Planctopirus limnophila (strain ATCC 43296 / DSM 3776 / IFAM 1008 / Mu 290) TaxID=521674 RepID=D5SRX8_PLAL2|nr:hypothetical protein Plim_2880 [Planctopirus limnophila DSM 3776]